MKIYVGNLAEATTVDVLRETFSPYGAIDKVHLAADKETGKLKGFGFVIMPQETEGTAAITALHSTTVDGNVLKVVESKDKNPQASAAATETSAG